MWRPAPKCSHHHIAYNSCKNRHCPKCQGPAARTGWRLAPKICCPWNTSTSSSRCRQRSPGSHIGTRRRSMACCSRHLRETVATIAADPKRLGARVGMTSVLHTWGSALTHHPHIHMIVPGGGLSPDGNSWVACKPGFFLARSGVVALCSDVCSLRGCWLCTVRANSLLRRSDWPLANAKAFATGSPRSAKQNGSFMPNHPSADLRRCWLTSADTPTAWRSQTAA